jgi:hypothetical protein
MLFEPKYKFKMLGKTFEPGTMYKINSASRLRVFSEMQKDLIIIQDWRDKNAK